MKDIIHLPSNISSVRVILPVSMHKILLVRHLLACYRHYQSQIQLGNALIPFNIDYKSENFITGYLHQGSSCGHMPVVENTSQK